jgi:hypothetical protein
MFRLLFYPALALNFCVFGANAAERYGEWLLEQPRSSVLTLSFKQSAPLDDKMTTSELGFICDQRDSSRNIAVILIPLDETFKNERAAIPILIQKNSDQYAHCFPASPVNALCTSDREIPNSRAIRAGVTPALNAARTAFDFPCGKEAATASACCLR